MSSLPRHSLTGARWVFPKVYLERSRKEVPPSHSNATLRSTSPLAHPQVTNLASALGIKSLLAAILLARGWQHPARAQAFLSASPDGLHDPLLLPDMAPAVEMIAEALDQGDHIRLHGDYDVDGVTACALLARALSALGGKVDVYLPHRISEGYGLSRAAIEKAAAEGVRLLITADCGSGFVSEIARAQALGLRVVVTDHHHPPSQDSKYGVQSPVPAQEVAEVNPRRGDSQYPFPDLSGVGIAFKLVEALAAHRGLRPKTHWRFLDLVALGTVADVSPLLEENRILVKEGLNLIGRSRKAGICALMKAAGLSPPVSSRQVAFVLAPRLNAAGRLAHAREAFHLLTTSDAAEARRLAENLCQHNRARQEEESKTLREAQEMLEGECLQQEKLLFLAGQGWHPGVIGIVASRLVEAYHRPVFLVAVPDKTAPTKAAAVGSARSIAGFPLWEALWQCRNFLGRFGGHDQAAGFSVLPENISPLRESLCELAAGLLSEEQLQPALKIDALARLSDLTLAAVEELGRLEPFGSGNPVPTIAVRNLRVVEIARAGENGSHLRLHLHEPGGPAIRAIWFHQGDMAERLKIGQNVEVCLNPMTTIWNGVRTLELRVKDVAVEN